MSENGKFFILGVGAQKAGTTWLASQLEKTSFFSNGGIKEFHIFNKLFAKSNSKKDPYKFIKKAKINGHIKLGLTDDAQLFGWIIGCGVHMTKLGITLEAVEIAFSGMITQPEIAMVRIGPIRKFKAERTIPGFYLLKINDS